MRLWIEVYVESRPVDTDVYTAQEVVRYDCGSVETTYLDSGIDRVDIMNKVAALGYKNHVLFVNKASKSVLV